MAEAIDIRELNERIERQSAFVTNLMTGMDQVIVGQKHFGRIITYRFTVRWSYPVGRCSGSGKDSGDQNACIFD